jgi:hypothetical protein
MNSRDIAISSLFGLVIFSEKALLPPPYDKMVSVLLQIVFLSLAFLIVGFPGPVLTGFVSGLLTASMRAGTAWMTFTFALLYGLIVGGIYMSFNVVNSGRVMKWRLIAASLFSTLLVGVMSATVSILLGMIPYNAALISIIMVAGAIQGAVGGFITYYVFERHLQYLLP